MEKTKSLSLLNDDELFHLAIKIIEYSDDIHNIESCIPIEVLKDYLKCYGYGVKVYNDKYDYIDYWKQYFMGSDPDNDVNWY